MKNNLLNPAVFLLSIVSLVNISCSKEDQKATYIEEDASVSAPAANAVEVAKNNASQSLLPSQSPVQNSGNGAVNPPHGQPGHRCEIPVGAPLNAQVENSSPQPVQVNPNPAPVQQTITAPGMNPPHGEPGHRCDIAVGAPLNS